MIIKLAASEQIVERLWYMILSSQCQRWFIGHLIDRAISLPLSNSQSIIGAQVNYAYQQPFYYRHQLVGLNFDGNSIRTKVLLQNHFIHYSLFNHDSGSQQQYKFIPI